MRLVEYPNKADWEALARRPVFDPGDIYGRVRPILEAVRQEGDAALKRFNAEFDSYHGDRLEVTVQEMEAAVASVPVELRRAIVTAAGSIRKFHQAQLRQEAEIETFPGVTCWRRSVGMEKVGLYIPGGTAPLYSTVLMLAVPASIAGCREVVLCTPPGPEGRVHPAILFAASLCGVDRVFRLGGAQAIAALAYGTPTVPRVSKIFGPGNQYVTAAKQLVTETGTAIDMPAGPSEVVVVADGTAPPAFVAADLLAQAEHGRDSQSLLLTDSADLARAVMEEVNRQLADLPRADIASVSMANSAAIVFADLEEALEFSNLYAPEHLIIAADNPRRLAGLVVNAGSVFLGLWTPESLGDYASGTNHTLPTNGYARSYSGVSVDSFVRKITYQEASRDGLAQLGPTVEMLASGESLEGHRRAVSIRLNYGHED